MEQAERVAFCGLGIMGGPMAANLARAGFDVSRVDRTARGRPSASPPSTACGRPPRPAEAAEGAGAVVTMVVDAPEVEAVLLGDGGAADALEPGSLCLDMSTIAPSAARELGEALRRARPGASWRPRSPGSRPKAEDGTLTIMAGGERPRLRARPGRCSRPWAS